MSVKHYLFVLFLICWILLIQSAWASSIILLDSRITSSTTAHHRGDTISIMYSINDTNFKPESVGVGATLTRVGENFTQIIPINNVPPLETISFGSKILNEEIHLPDDIGTGTYDVYGTLWSDIPEVGTIIDQKNSGQITIVSDWAHSTPSEPLTPTATLSDNVMQISWTKPIEDGGSSITKYIVYKFVDDEWSKETSTISTSVQINVQPNLLNIFKVTAVNSNGEGESSTPFSNYEIIDDTHGGFITPPRTKNENGQPLELSYVGDKAVQLDPNAPVPQVPGHQCEGTDNGVIQEGWNWKIDPPNPNIIGFSSVWKMPEGNIVGESNAGVLYNPVNFYAKDMESNTRNFFQVTWGKGDFGVNTNKLNDHISMVVFAPGFFSKPLGIQLSPGSEYFIDALIENKSLASRNSYVVEISKGNKGFLSNLTPDEIQKCYDVIGSDTQSIGCTNPKTTSIPQLSGFQSFQDQWVRWHDENGGFTSFTNTLEPDKISNQSAIIYRGHNSLFPYIHDHTIVKSDGNHDKIVPNRYMNSTAQILMPFLHSENIIVDNPVCESQSIPEFSYSMLILIISIVSVIVVGYLLRCSKHKLQYH